MSTGQRVAVVTGGGGGIGAAIAEELGRDGWHVVTVDPLVTLDGSAPLTDAGPPTAERIVASGGSARSSSVSVTDGPAVRALFEELIAERGRLDAVVNVAGITRPTGYGRGLEEDWRAVLEVHLGGYLNVLGAALPLMAEAGHGRVVGVTSGSGWRAADAGAYSCAKRAVASLTWQLGRHAPPGVTVNAISPIAATRMVAGALARAPAAATGGLSLASMPAPDDLGPIGAYMAGDDFAWCNGRVLFAAGSEVAVVDEPRLLEVVGTEGVASLDHVLEGVIARSIVPAETSQASQGGSNARFTSLFSEPDESAPADASAPPSGVRSCVLVTDRPPLADALTAALEARKIACWRVDPATGFEDASRALSSAASEPIDAVVVALSSPRTSTPSGAGWEMILDEHRGLVDAIHSDAAWTRAAADHAAGAGRAIRFVNLSDATTAGGRSRGQASAQAARVAAKSTKGAVTAFAVSLEASHERAGGAAAALVAHLLGDPDPGGLAGAELVIGAGWMGLRSHPRPSGSVAYRGPEVPPWLGPTLREIAGGPEEGEG